LAGKLALVIVLAREVFVCKCSTDVRADDPDASEEVRKVRWVSGTEEHLPLLDPAHHDAAHVEDLRARLARGEKWVLGLAGERVVSYTWLHTRRTIEYPYLPGCAFNVAPDAGYGYDAWTPPELRGGGLRRTGFLQELNVLRALGIAWETSFFVKHQIEGATRSLGKVGIAIIPIWRAHLVKRDEVAFELLVPGDTTATPVGR
jgi:hypothetical protein